MAPRCASLHGPGCARIGESIYSALGEEGVVWMMQRSTTPEARAINLIEARVREIIGALSSLADELGALAGPGGLSVTLVGDAAPFSFSWPAGSERYTRASAWEITEGGAVIPVVLGHSRREAWGR